MQSDLPAIPREFTRGVIADCLKLQVFLCANAGILARYYDSIFAVFAVIFACIW